MRCAVRIDIMGDRGGADEAHRLDVRVLEDCVDRFLVAVDDIEDTGRRARFHEQLGEAQRNARILLRRFADESVAAGDGQREHPHRHHGREVERRDARHHADRLADRVGVHVGGDVLGVAALREMRDAAGELDHFDAALDVAF